MIVIRPTADLAKRMKLKLSTADEQSSTLLGDWYALDLVLDRQQYILCVSEIGRLPLVLRAAPYANFHKRLPSAIADLLFGIGVPPRKISAGGFQDGKFYPSENGESISSWFYE